MRGFIAEVRGRYDRLKEAADAKANLLRAHLQEAISDKNNYFQTQREVILASREETEEEADEARVAAQADLDAQSDAVASTAASVDDASTTIDANRDQLMQGQQELLLREQQNRQRLNSVYATSRELDARIADLEAIDERTPEQEAQLQQALEVKERLAEGYLSFSEINTNLSKERADYNTTLDQLTGTQMDLDATLVALGEHSLEVEEAYLRQVAAIDGYEGRVVANADLALENLELQELQTDTELLQLDDYVNSIFELSNSIDSAFSQQDLESIAEIPQVLTESVIEPLDDLFDRDGNLDLPKRSGFFSSVGNIGVGPVTLRNVGNIVNPVRWVNNYAPQAMLIAGDYLFPRDRGVDQNGDPLGRRTFAEIVERRRGFSVSSWYLENSLELNRYMASQEGENTNFFVSAGLGILNTAGTMTFGLVEMAANPLDGLDGLTNIVVNIGDWAGRASAALVTRNDAEDQREVGRDFVYGFKSIFGVQDYDSMGAGMNDTYFLTHGATNLLSMFIPVGKISTASSATTRVAGNLARAERSAFASAYRAGLSRSFRASAGEAIGTYWRNGPIRGLNPFGRVRRGFGNFTRRSVEVADDIQSTLARGIVDPSDASTALRSIDDVFARRTSLIEDIASSGRSFTPEELAFITETARLENQLSRFAAFQRRAQVYENALGRGTSRFSERIGSLDSIRIGDELSLNGLETFRVVGRQEGRYILVGVDDLGNVLADSARTLSFDDLARIDSNTGMLETIVTRARQPRNIRARMASGFGRARDAARNGYRRVSESVDRVNLAQMEQAVVPRGFTGSLDDFVRANRSSSNPAIRELVTLYDRVNPTPVAPAARPSLVSDASRWSAEALQMTRGLEFYRAFQGRSGSILDDFLARQGLQSRGVGGSLRRGGGNLFENRGLVEGLGLRQTPPGSANPSRYNVLLRDGTVLDDVTMGIPDATQPRNVGYWSPGGQRIDASQILDIFDPVQNRSVLDLVDEGVRGTLANTPNLQAMVDITRATDAANIAGRSGNVLLSPARGAAGFVDGLPFLRRYQFSSRILERAIAGGAVTVPALERMGVIVGRDQIVRSDVEGAAIADAYGSFNGVDLAMADRTGLTGQTSETPDLPNQEQLMESSNYARAERLNRTAYARLIARFPEMLQRVLGLRPNENPVEMVASSDDAVKKRFIDKVYTFQRLARLEEGDGSRSRLEADGICGPVTMILAVSMDPGADVNTKNVVIDEIYSSNSFGSNVKTRLDEHLTVLGLNTLGTDPTVVDDEPDPAVVDDPAATEPSPAPAVADAAPTAAPETPASLPSRPRSSDFGAMLVSAQANGRTEYLASTPRRRVTLGEAVRLPSGSELAVKRGTTIISNSPVEHRAALEALRPKNASGSSVDLPEPETEGWPVPSSARVILDQDVYFTEGTFPEGLIIDGQFDLYPS